MREHVIRVDLKVTFNNNGWGTLKLDAIDEAIDDIERVPDVTIERYGLPAASHVAWIPRAHQMAEWIHCITRAELRHPEKIALAISSTSISSIHSRPNP